MGSQYFVFLAFHIFRAGESTFLFARDIRDWHRLTNRLYIWDYTTGFSHYLLPFPNYYVLGPNVRFVLAKLAMPIEVGRVGQDYLADERVLDELAAKGRVEGLLLSGGLTHCRQAGEFLLDGELFRN